MEVKYMVTDSKNLFDKIVKNALVGWDKTVEDVKFSGNCTMYAAKMIITDSNSAEHSLYVNEELLFADENVLIVNFDSVLNNLYLQTTNTELKSWTLFSKEAGGVDQLRKFNTKEELLESARELSSDFYKLLVILLV